MRPLHLTQFILWAKKFQLPDQTIEEFIDYHELELDNFSVYELKQLFSEQNQSVLDFNYTLLVEKKEMSLKDKPDFQPEDYKGWWQSRKQLGSGEQISLGFSFVRRNDIHSHGHGHGSGCYTLRYGFTNYENGEGDGQFRKDFNNFSEFYGDPFVDGSGWGDGGQVKDKWFYGMGTGTGDGEGSGNEEFLQNK